MSLLLWRTNKLFFYSFTTHFLMLAVASTWPLSQGPRSYHWKVMHDGGKKIKETTTPPPATEDILCLNHSYTMFPCELHHIDLSLQCDVGLLKDYRAAHMLSIKSACMADFVLINSTFINPMFVCLCLQRCRGP